MYARHYTVVRSNPGAPGAARTGDGEEPRPIRTLEVLSPTTSDVRAMARELCREPRDGKGEQRRRRCRWRRGGAVRARGDEDEVWRDLPYVIRAIEAPISVTFSLARVHLRYNRVEHELKLGAQEQHA